MSCPECFTGAVHHNEKPLNSIKTIHGRPTYVAEPPDNASPKGIIVIVPDAFGLPFINNQILADNYARKGQFKVYLPDFMDGHCAPLWMINTFPRVLATSTLWDWVSKPYHIGWAMYGFLPFVVRNSFAKSMPKVEKFLEDVRRNEGANLPIGCAGFCWGGKHVIALAHGKEVNGKTLADASFTAHPSNLSIPEDLKAVKKPLSIANGTKDAVLSLKQLDEIEATLKSLPEVDSEVVRYDGAGHGFAVRADPGNEKQSQQARDAEDQAVKFFARAFASIT